ncbi:hypothetical protein CcaverHIS002_0102330 [Cutaneotrichosporon cavernicola]|uniref:S-adenosyl-L-methionine-dependent methyltransferase n=1 Tax=Cutaneotrichosporon cavernicola TaxID=279322 RepID=A0AA48I5N6_9TREE|nr:uncharacterized protein CcaverHIS019_0102280 [Cutaneotrichosporon cavernicola]BEI79704.1 hypothetical protein CcaverHIS002_0102330 [Cutaneotrichosporon cavernicola]BEI87510.1 hypothetical protein CcaverHIS019_0102280 [Cutaneotrichosporon cavernicola]BEI95281.1 hypothetical protein CcaverHIS631_0102300 [Cutaneotrichosporon cavernicola]BEJ03054.1 hypothetical protein CcaverHIS641_0102290 [Cutaneotrichosporon cavernicola]
MAPFLQWFGPAIVAAHLQLIRHMIRTHFNSLPLAAHKLEVYAALAAVSVLSSAVFTYIPGSKRPKATTLLFLAAYATALPALARSGRWLAEFAGELGPEWGAVFVQVVLCAPVVALIFPLCAPPVTRQGAVRPFIAFCAYAMPVSILAWVSDTMESNDTIYRGLADEPELGMLGMCMMLNSISVVYLWVPEEVVAPAAPAEPAAPAPVKGSDTVDAALKKGKKGKKTEKAEKKDEQPPTDRPVAQAYPGLLRRRPAKLTLALRALPLLTAFAGFTLYKQAPFAEDGVRIHKSVASVTGRIIVGDNVADGYRFLRNDKTLIGGMWMHDNGDPTGLSAELGDSVFTAMTLQEVCLLARAPVKNDKVLVLGLGAGIGASYYHGRGLDVTAVEVDPAVVAAAKDYFDLPDVKVEVEDAAMYVHNADESTKYAYLIHDVFSANGMPTYLFTKEFWAEAKSLLTSDGLVVVNVAGPVNGPLTRRIVATLVSEIPNCRAFTDIFRPGVYVSKVKNFVFICSTAGMPEFRQATKADTLGSPLREQVYGQNRFEKNEVAISEFLKTQNEAELEEDVILRRGEKRDGKWDLELAHDVWYNLRSLMSPQLWVAY